MDLNNIPIYSSEDLRKALPMPQAVEAMKTAFRIISENTAVVPERLHLDIPETKGGTLTMPVYVPETGYVCLKFLSIFNNNPVKYQLPAIQAVVLLMSAENGEILALMDGGAITAIRTGAASGAATDLLAREDSATAAIFGAGVQGKTQLEAVCVVRDIRRVYIFDKDEAAAENFQTEMTEKLGIKIDIPTKPEDLREADIICTATSSSTPVFDHGNVSSGTHINAIGAYKTDTREIPGSTVASSRLFVDKVSSCLAEAGDILIPIEEGIITKEHIIGEVGHLVKGLTDGRLNDSQITMFKSVGNAVQDLVAAAEVYNFYNFRNFKKRTITN